MTSSASLSGASMFMSPWSLRLSKASWLANLEQLLPILLKYKSLCRERGFEAIFEKCRKEELHEEHRQYDLCHQRRFTKCSTN
jgi:hypothetical protein